jgi:uncharacterized membrane protein YdjX (TVP38/TMEM64 family)
MSDTRRMSTEGEPASAASQAEEPARFAIAASVGAAVLLVALVLLVDPLHDAVGDAVSGDTDSLRADLLGLGVGGVVLVLALALVHAVVFYPTEILNTAAGFVYGFWLGLPLMLVGWVINGIVCHQIGRYAARPLLLRLLGEPRFRGYERAVERGGITLLLAMRLVPVVPFSLFSYVAGSARVPLRTFIWTTVVGYLPLTALFVLFGSRLEEISPTDPVLWGGAAVLIALLLVTRKVLPALSEDRVAEDRS